MLPITQSFSQQPKRHLTIDIGKIREALPERYRKYLIFLHSFSGCDTVSAISGFGKSTLLTKFCKTEKAEGAMNVFLDVRAKKDDITKPAVNYSCSCSVGNHWKTWGTWDLTSSASGPLLGASSLRNCPQQQELQHSTLSGLISRLEIGWCCKARHWMSWIMDGSLVTKVMNRYLQQNPLHRTIFWSLSAATVWGTVQHSGAAVKSKESSVFLLAATVMAALARTPTSPMTREVREMPTRWMNRTN